MWLIKMINIDNNLHLSPLNITYFTDIYTFIISAYCTRLMRPLFTNFLLFFNGCFNNGEKGSVACTVNMCWNAAVRSVYQKNAKAIMYQHIRCMYTLLCWNMLQSKLLLVGLTTSGVRIFHQAQLISNGFHWSWTLCFFSSWEINSKFSKLTFRRRRIICFSHSLATQLIFWI